MCGEVSILVMSVFVPGLSEVYVYVWMEYYRGVGPCRPQVTVTLSTIRGQCATSDQTKGHSR